MNIVDHYGVSPSEITALPAGAVKTEIGDGLDIDFKTVLVEKLFEPAPGGGSSPVVTDVYESLAVDGTDFHQVKGASTDIPFVDAADGVYFSKTGADFEALQDIAHLEVDAIVTTTNSAVNNRAIYRLELVLRDSGDALINTWRSTTMYIRDDASGYDSGSMQRNRTIRGILTGDKLTVRVFVMDSQTGGSSVAPVSGAESSLNMVVVE